MLELSCYTTALHGYLATEWDADAVIARSVRLSVRADHAGCELAFSHHEPSLDLLPDGSHLSYAGASAPREAIPRIADELARHHRVLVVADKAKLPWSVTREGAPAPHWLLVDGRKPRGWHVTDAFAATLPAGEQRPHRGWLGTEELLGVMSLPSRWARVHRLRNRMAFGVPVAVPSCRALWLCRRPGPGGGTTLPTGSGWRIGDAEALPFLVEYAAEAGDGFAVHLDDLWAAARHRSFSYGWRLQRAGAEGERTMLREAMARWDALPRVLRLAVESSARGRPRLSLIRSALAALPQVTPAST